MKTFTKLFVVVCVLDVAIIANIALRPHQSHRDAISNVRITPSESVQVGHQHNGDSTRLAGQSTSLRVEPVTADADFGSVDTLEDPDKIREWTRRNPQRAQDWLVGAPEGAKRDVVAEMVCLEIAETNPGAAVALADGYGSGCTNALENLMIQWADKDIQAAYRWAATRQPGAQRDSLLSRIAFVESKTDPQGAATLVAEQIASEQIQDEAAISVLYQWAQKDPDAAMRWAQSFPAGILHDRAVNEVQNVMTSGENSSSKPQPKT